MNAPRGAPDPDLGTFARNSSFLRLVVLLRWGERSELYRERRARYEELVGRLDTAGWRQPDRANDWQLLPHLGRRLGAGPTVKPTETARLLEMPDDLTAAVWGATRTVIVARIFADRGRTDWEGSVVLRGIGVMLSTVGVGIAFVDVRAAAGDDARDWLRLCSWMRGLDPEPYGLVLDPNGTPRSMRDVFNAIIDTLAGGRQDLRWTSEADRAIGYHCSLFDSRTTGQLSADGNLTDTGQMVFERSWRGFTPANVLAIDDADTPATVSIERRFANGFMVASMGGGGLVAIDVPNTIFYRKLMPEHMAIEYSIGFFLALLQREELEGLSDQVAETWLGAGDAEREQLAIALREQLLAFMAQLNFAVVSRSPNHQTYAMAWRRALQIEDLVAEVTDEADAIERLLSERRARREDSERRRRDLLIGALGHAVAAVSMTVGVLSLFDLPAGVNLGVIAGSGLVGAVLGARAAQELRK